jgi:D-alanine transaminase
VSKPRIVYVNGRFCPIEEASISIMDRGFLFADGIYEVTAVLNGKFVDNAPHLARLDRCLGELGIPNPHTLDEWTALQSRLVADNGLAEGLVYIEVTRGAAEREFSYEPGLTPTVVMFTQAKNVAQNPLAVTGAKVISVPDIRWERRDIKSVGLLAQVMAKQSAKLAGAQEAFMVQDGFVTEGGSSTAYIITEAGEIITRPLSRDILPGITRAAVLKLAAENNLTLVERPFSIEEAHAASEAFYTSASAFVMPVVELDGKQIGGGQPGPRVRRLRELYFAMAAGQA